MYTTQSKTQWQAVVNHRTGFRLSQRNGKFHDKLNYSRVIKIDFALVTCLLSLSYPKLYYPKFHHISRLLLK